MSLYELENINHTTPADAGPRWDPGEIPTQAHQGWPHLAEVMAASPALAAFPRFRELNIKSLLYYQIELHQLKRDLNTQEWTDAAGSGNPDGEKRDWTSEADDLVKHPESEQWQKVKKMRCLLKEYNKALLQYSQICALPDPEQCDMRTLRRWLKDARYGDYTVNGQFGLRDTWGNVSRPPTTPERGCIMSLLSVLVALFHTPTIPDEDKRDLVSTAPERKMDGLTRWVGGELIPWYKDLKIHGHHAVHKPRPQTDIEGNPPSGDWVWWQHLKDPEEVKLTRSLEILSEAHPLRITNALSTLLACLLPVAATCVLAQVQGLRNLLIGLAGFTVAFTLGLMAVTQNTSTRTEIFAATAAFSAVMVVFISPSPAYVLRPGTPTTIVPTYTVG